MKKFVFIMLAISLVVAGGISYFASPHPDGLEKVAENLGFVAKTQSPAPAALPDYTVPGLRGFFSKSLAGIIGVLATFGATVLVTRLIKKEKYCLSQRREDAKKR